MADDADPRPSLANDRIAQIAVNAFTASSPVTQAEISAVCDELLYRRRQSRHDSRRAQQIKRLRWLVETLITKVESLEAAVAKEEAGEDAGQGDG